MFDTKRNNLEALIVRGIDLTIEFATLGEYGINGYIGDLPHEPDTPARPAIGPPAVVRPERVSLPPRAPARQMRPATAAARAAFDMRTQQECAARAARAPGSGRSRAPQPRKRRHAVAAPLQPCLSPTTARPVKRSSPAS